MAKANGTKTATKPERLPRGLYEADRKSTRLNSSH